MKALFADPAVDEIWSRFLLAPDTLAPEDDERMAAAVAAQPDLVDRLLDDEALSGLLRAFGRSKDAGAFAHRFDRRLALEDDRGFVPALARRLEQETVSLVRRLVPWFAGTAAIACVLVLVLRARVSDAPSKPSLANQVAPQLHLPLPTVLPPDAAFAVPSPGESETLVALDLDHPDGLRIEGRPVRGPERRRCLAGIIYNPSQNSFGVRVFLPQEIPYSPDLYVSFDYWIGEWTDPEPPQMVVAIGAGRKIAEYETAAPPPVPVSWQTVTVRVADMHNPFLRDSNGRLRDFPTPGPRSLAIHPQVGAPTVMVKVRVEGLRQDVFFVDNIRIFRRR